MVIPLPFFAPNRASLNHVGPSNGYDAGEDEDPDDWDDATLPDDSDGVDEPDDHRSLWEDWDPLDDEPPEPAPGDFWPDDPDPDD